MTSSQMGGKLSLVVTTAPTPVTTVCRHVASFSESYLWSVASKAANDLRQTVENQTTKFTEFEVCFSLSFSLSLNSLSTLSLSLCLYRYLRNKSLTSLPLTALHSSSSPPHRSSCRSLSVKRSVPPMRMPTSGRRRA